MKAWVRKTIVMAIVGVWALGGCTTQDEPTPTAEPVTGVPQLVATPTTGPFTATPRPTVTPTAIAGQNQSSTSGPRILYDTTHREWGIHWGEGDREVVENLGHGVDMLEVGGFDDVGYVELEGQAGAVETFEFWIDPGITVFGVWLAEAPVSNAGLTLWQDGAQESYSSPMWALDTPVPFLIEEPQGGMWQAELRLRDDERATGYYRIQLAAFEESPLVTAMRQYRLLWFQNPHNPFLPREQVALVDFVEAGGGILIIAKESTVENVTFLFDGASGPEEYTYQNGTHLYRYERGSGRIAWFEPVDFNPNLYWDNGRDKPILTTGEIQQILAWLEGKPW